MSKIKYQTVSEFYPFYLSQHLDPTSRYLHIYGTSTGVLLSLVLLLKGHLFYVPWALLFGYGCAWIGHLKFEKNLPATFSYPLKSLACDFLMIRDYFQGTLDEKISKIKIEKN